MLKSLNVLDITQLDKFMSIFAEVILEVEDVKQAEAEQIPGQTSNGNDDSRPQAMSGDDNSSFESARSYQLSGSLNPGLNAPS